MASEQQRHYLQLMRYIRPYWPAWGLLALTALGASLLAVAQPWPLQVLTDQVLGDTPMPVWLQRVTDAIGISGSRSSLLAGVVAAGLVIFLLSALADAIQCLGVIRVGQRMVNNLAADLFARLQRRGLTYHQRSSVGDSMARITSDAWSVYRICDALLMKPLQAVPILVLALVLMVRMDPMLTAVSLVAAPAMTAAAMVFGRRVRSAAELRRKADVQLQSHVQETLSGLGVVQAFGQEERERRRFEDHAGEVLRAHRRTIWSTSLYEMGSGLTAAAGGALILWLAARRVMAGQLTLGQALVFISYLGMLQAQIKSLLAVHATLQQQRVNMDRVLEILNAADDLPLTPGAAALSRVRGDVRFDGVTFGYERGRPVLEQIDLGIAAGEVIALVGATGSGKSTLLSLVPRCYDPWSGRVLIDGQDVRSLDLASLRRQVAVVPQEAVLFPITIAENIAFGRPEATREQVEAAAKAAHAHDFIAALPAGYDTPVGQRGATLSGGERQRLSIARALLLDSPILLLDEPTASLDADSEAAVMAALEHLMRGRTTLIAAHRLSTIRRANRIIVIRDGRIVESGVHEQLLAAGGFYAALHQVAQRRMDRHAGDPAVLGTRGEA